MPSDLLSSIIPLSIGAAFSPTVLAFTILILGGKRAPRERVAFMVLGMFIVLMVLASVASAATQISKSGDVRYLLKLLDVVFALIMLYLGIRGLTRKYPDRHSGSILTQKTHGDVKPVRFVPIGSAVMLTDISSIVLFIPAIRDIGLSQASTQAKLLFATIPFTAVLIPAVLPLFADIIAPKSSEMGLNTINDWLGRHIRLVTVGVSFLFGAFLLWKGLSGLLID